MPTPKSIENKPIILYSKNTDEITKTIQSSVFSIPYVDEFVVAVSGRPNAITLLQVFRRGKTSDKIEICNSMTRVH